jgi:site-specific DNA-methyltransferase (adenine-specific)
MVVAIEDAGFEIRDQIMWVYGSGFPKSMDISKAIDKQAGAEREVIGSKVTGKALDKASRTGEFADGNHGGQQVVEVTAPATAAAKTWQGWGTALKPAHEPIVMARKPVDGTVANNVLKHGVGGINIDDCRVGMSEEDFAKLSAGVEAIRKRGGTMENSWKNSSDLSGANPANAKGRFPANFIHDGSDEVLALTGDAGRFFYCAKASKAERNAGLEGLPAQRHADRTVDDGVGGDNPRNRTNTAKQNFHPTVKPITLMRYLVRLVTPHNGTVLDPFAGSGSTLVAATLEGFECVGMELMDDYLPIIEARLNWADNQETETPSLFD